jgi:hypothetical protein
MPCVQVLRDKLAEKQREARQAASAAERALAEADAPEDGRILAAKAVQDLAGSCDVVLTTYAVLAKEVCVRAHEELRVQHVEGLAVWSHHPFTARLRALLTSVA